MEKAIMKSDWEKVAGTLVFAEEGDDYPETVPRRCSVKKVVPRNFAKFTGKQLPESLFQ